MLFWLIAGLAVFLINVFLPAALYLPSEGLLSHLGSRDKLPTAGKYVERGRRALANFQENLPFFLTFGILALVVEGANVEQAILGAQIFVFARFFYLVFYLISIPFTRSLAYTAGFIGTAIMMLALL